MITASLNMSGFNHRVAAFKAGARRARRNAAIHDSRLIVRVIERIARRDTNRYVRGWLIAANQARLGPFTVPDVRRSKNWEMYLMMLQDQITHFASVVADKEQVLRDWFARRGGATNSYARRLQSEIAKASWRQKRAEEELRKYITAPTVAPLFFSAGAYVERNNLRKLSTVRDKVYGGTGNFAESDDKVVITLHNEEPHSTILERRFRTMARALAAAGSKQARMQRLKRGYAFEFQNAAAKAAGGYRVA